MNFEIIIGISVILLMTAGVYLQIQGKKSRAEQEKNKSKFYRKVYFKLLAFPLTSKKILLLQSKLQAKSIYRQSEVQIMTAKLYITYGTISVIIIIASLFLYKEAISMLMGITFSLLLNNVLIDKAIDNINYSIVRGMQKAVSAIRQEYLKLNSIPDALANASIPKVVSKPIEEIYNILTMPNSNIRLEEFYASGPHRSLETLASVCYNINNSGDEKDDQGNSSFLSSMAMIASDLNMEMERMILQKNMFGSMEYLTFIPLLFNTIIENLLRGVIPGTAIVYDSPVGFIIRIVIVITSILCYLKISTINRISPVKEDDRVYWAHKLLKYKGIAKFIDNIKCKNKKRKTLKLKKLMAKAITHNTIEIIYVQKVVFAIAVFILSLTSVIIAATLGREAIYNNIAQLTITPSKEMEDYSREDIMSLDKEYMDGINDGTLTKDEQLMELVKAKMPTLSDLQIMDQIQRLRDKKKTYDGSYVKGWHIIVCLLVTLIAWFVPERQLKSRAKLVDDASDEDFLQLQTLMSILMYTNLDTMDVIKQMSQQSKIFKMPLLYCYHSYVSNPEREITRLKSKTNIIAFHSFVDKLKTTISDLSLREAFGDLIIEREHIAKIRDMAIMKILGRKRRLCSRLSMIPMMLMIVGEFIYPIGYLGVYTLMTAVKMIQ